MERTRSDVMWTSCLQVNKLSILSLRQVFGTAYKHFFVTLRMIQIPKNAERKTNLKIEI